MDCTICCRYAKDITFEMVMESLFVICSCMIQDSCFEPTTVRGYDYDEETGYYYLQSRYYDPVTGRFLNVDDVVFLNADTSNESNNLFAYCKNNPINGIDPYGYFYVSNAKLRKAIKVALAVFGLNPIGSVILAIGVRTVRKWIIAKAALLGAKFGAIGGPVASAVLSGLFALCIGWSSWIIVDALLQGRGISITWKYTYWGTPFGLDMGVR